MNRNFFIRLAFAAHRVADALPREEQIAQEIREAANAILTDLILLTDKGTTRSEKKQDLLFQIERQIDVLLVYLNRAKKEGRVNQENFSLLETEYGRIRELLEIFEDIPLHDGRGSREQRLGEKGKEESMQSLPEADNETEPPPQKVEEKSVLTQRQRRIIEFLRTKENAQVWELQKVLPEVTKRTLRRDLDELLQKNLVERKGAWNAVAYELK